MQSAVSDRQTPNKYCTVQFVKHSTRRHTPFSRSSLSHAQRFMGFFHNRNSLPPDSVSLMTCSVSDNIVSFTRAPTPCSSLSHTCTFSWGFFVTETQKLPCVRFCDLFDYCVSDNIVTFTPTPTPSSRSSLSYAHIIHTPNLPTTTLLTITCTQVLWFLTCLTRSPPRIIIKSDNIRISLGNSNLKNIRVLSFSLPVIIKHNYTEPESTRCRKYWNGKCHSEVVYLNQNIKGRKSRSRNVFLFIINRESER